jgi:hypothetical protein
MSDFSEAAKTASCTPLTDPCQFKRNCHLLREEAHQLKQESHALRQRSHKLHQILFQMRQEKRIKTAFSSLNDEA